MNRTDYQAAKAACENLAAVPIDVLQGCILQCEEAHMMTVRNFVMGCERHFPRTLAMLHKAMELLGPAVMANGYDTRERDALLREWNTAPPEQPKCIADSIGEESKRTLPHHKYATVRTKKEALASVKKPKTRRGK